MNWNEKSKEIEKITDIKINQDGILTVCVELKNSFVVGLINCESPSMQGIVNYRITHTKGKPSKMEISYDLDNTNNKKLGILIDWILDFVEESTRCRMQGIL